MDLRKIRQAAAEQGWTFRTTKKGEAWIPPDPAKSRVQVHRTPSDHRALRNFLGELKRQGLVWPWPPK